MGIKRHQSGVNNELDTLKILKQIGVASDKAKHAGGPRLKADIIDDPKSFSVKLHTSSGWEWVNTTALPQSVREQFSEFFDEVSDTVVTERSKYVDKVVDSTTARFHEYATNALNFFESGELKELLIDKFVDPNANLICAVNDKKQRVMSCFVFEAHPVVKLLQEGWMPELVDTGANISRIIILTKNGDVKQTNFRLTVNFNNGIPALLGLKKTKTGGKKKSYLTVKIQQTRVPELLDQVGAEVYSY